MSTIELHPRVKRMLKHINPDTSRQIDMAGYMPKSKKKTYSQDWSRR